MSLFLNNVSSAPNLFFDFANTKKLDSRITYTRSGVATYFDNLGILRTANANEPRFDHDPSTLESRGLLIEEGRTNSIRNSQAGGSTNGVIGVTGVAPTNWQTSAPTGIAREIIGTGTLNGFSYIDIKFSGTNTSGSSGSFLVGFDTTTQIVAANGQTWAGSVYIALVSGSFSGATGPAVDLVERSVGGSYLAGTQTNISAATSALTRFSATRTFNQATTERTTVQVAATVPNGSTIDVTLRIAAPQLEQGAFATSYIPTTSAAVTRGADVAMVTPISSFFNPNEGTILNDFSVYVLDGATTLRGITQFTETGGVTNRLQTGYRGNGTYSFSAVASNTLEMEIATTTLVTANTICRAAQSYKSGDSARSFNNATITTSVSSITSATRERMRFGDNGTAMLNGHIRKVAYWPKRLSNTELQALTV